MEFSYRISEAEYLRASRLKPLRSGVAWVLKAVAGIIMFWICIFFGLMVLWAVVQRSSSVSHQPPANHVGAGKFLNAAVLNLGPFIFPFIVIGGAAIYMLFGLEPMLKRREYRRDARMQGQFTATIGQGSILIRDAYGASSQASPDGYKSWIESNGLFVLQLRSGGNVIVSLAGLSDVQRGELRSLLTATLPKK
jgi:hypothetical protein